MLAKIDSDVIQSLLEHGDSTISEMESFLRVSATAVRQRLSRLMATGMVDRVTEGEGRGRPLHRYRVTEEGRKSLGNNLSDFAEALWQEIQAIPDESTRSQIIRGVVQRMIRTLSQQIEGKTAEQRIESIVTVFRDREIPIAVEKNTNG
ncbi:MAG: hypothetical protein AAGA30_17945, partial [Planctomycetota bacterium]